MLTSHFRTKEEFLKVGMWNKVHRMCLTQGEVAALTRYIRVACKHEGIDNHYTKQGYFPESLIAVLYSESRTLYPINWNKHD